MSTTDTLRSLVDMASLQNRSIERLRESIDEFRQTMSDSNNRLVASIELMDERLGNRIDALTVQVTQFSSGMDELKQLSRQILQAIERQNQAIDGHLTIANRQAENISQLIELAKLQQAAVDRFLGRN